MTDPQRPYNWYRHHAWGGLALLSILLTIHALSGLPAWILYPCAVVLLGYVIVSLVWTYRASPQLRQPDPVDAAHELKMRKLDAKRARKLAKNEAKRQKKQAGP